jgi:hypothetical protein
VVHAGLPEGFSHQSESSITADLPDHAWAVLLGRGIDERLEEAPAGLVSTALREALRRMDAAEPAAARHIISELVLEPSLDDRRLAGFVRADQRDRWRRLGELLPEPAAQRCSEVALWCDALSSDATSSDAVSSDKDLAG